VASHLVSGPGATLEIGDDVTIGCGAAIAAFEAVSIGDGTRIGPYVIIMDTNFHSSSGGQSLQHDCLPVVVGKGCRIGSRVTITRGVAIGDGAEILAGSVVTTSIPAGACAAGARARIIGRAGEIQSRWYGPAIALPEVLASPLGLGSPPDLDASEPARGYWSEARVRDVIAAVKARLAMDLDPALFGPATTLADIARAVQLASAKR
jgi:NDP-sugar pyrophosphorylase family protein